MTPQQAPIDRPHRKHQVAALVTDQDDGEDAGYDLPPPSKEGALAAPPRDANGNIQKADDDVYSKTGWAPRFGNPADKDTDTGNLLDHQDFLEGKIPDKFFGDWYHNAAIIVFACLASWVVAVLGGGLGWTFLVMAACGSYYRTSLRRVRRNFQEPTGDGCRIPGVDQQLHGQILAHLRSGAVRDYHWIGGSGS